MSVLSRLMARLHYQFKDQSLLEEALTHRSVEGGNNNERLEFLGDAVLGFVMAQFLYEKFPHSPEGQLTRLRAHLVKGEMLADLAETLQLGEYIKLGPGELRSGGFKRRSSLGNAMEALIGAIYLDSDLATLIETIRIWYGHRLETLSLEDSKQDAKSALQEYCQKRNWALPRYQVLLESGPEHEKTFMVSCIASALNQSAEAQGPTKKLAEQAAARLILEHIIKE